MLFLQTLYTSTVTLRELALADAPSLYEALVAARPETHVPLFIPTPPDSVEGFEHFITRSIRKREDGRGGCLGIIPDGAAGPIGIFQLTVVERTPLAVEWGFILAASHRGTGLFAASATLALDHLFDACGVQRVQGRSAVENVRAIRALEKLGAVAGPIVHEPAFFDRPRDGQVWTIFAADWRSRRLSAP